MRDPPDLHAAGGRLGRLRRGEHGTRGPVREGLADVDDELPDIQPGGVRVRGDAGAAGDGTLLRARHGARRGAVAGYTRGAPPDFVRTQRTLSLLAQNHLIPVASRGG